MEHDISIADLEKEIVEKTLHTLPQKVDKIILYGSYARGTHDEESDVDVMVLMDCSPEEIKQYRKSISRLSSRLGLKNDIEISLLLRDSATFYENIDILPFYKNVSSEGKILYAS